MAGDMVHGTIESSGHTIKNRLLNQAVRDVLADLDLRSMKRRSQLSLSGANDFIYDDSDGTYDLPALQAIGTQANTYEHHCPYDLKADRIIDIRKRTDRSGQYRLTSEEEFDRRKTLESFMVAVSHNSWARKLLVTGVTDINSALVHDCDDISTNGTFSAVGGASSVANEVTDFVEGDGAVKFNSDLGSTTAGIQNSTFTAVDLTAYEDQDLFVWVKIPNADDLTNFILRIGSDSSNYLQMTVTKTHEQLAFYAGWNLLRFSWANATETGSPDSSAIDYVSFYMTKSVAKAAATGWIVDRIIAMTNSGTDVVYYTKYGWQSSAGIYLESATADSDFINADTDEVNIIGLRAAYLYAVKLGHKDDMVRLGGADGMGGAYGASAQQYRLQHPSEALLLSTTSYHFASLEGDAVTTTD